MASYAEVAAMNAHQTPEEAAAPQPLEIIPSESASTSSLVDVDAPSVRTVPHDFFDQEIQTSTQAARIEREEEAEEAAAAAAASASASASAAAAKARRSKAKADTLVARTNEYLTNAFAGLSDGAASAVVFGNLVGVVAVSAWLSHKAWGLYESGRLSWKSVGLGVGIMGLVGATEVALGGYLYTSKSSRSKKNI